MEALGQGMRLLVAGQVTRGRAAASLLAALPQIETHERRDPKIADQGSQAVPGIC